DECSLPWVLPSPNLPTLDSAVVYPGGCLFEGTLLTEGRGTTRPFEIFGAPYVDPDALVMALTERELPGVCFRPLHFEPTFNKHAHTLCGGAQIHVLDREAFLPVRTTVEILAAIRRLWPDELGWLPPPYEYERELMPIDILAGSPQVREAIDAFSDVRELATSWETELRQFDAEVRSFELYD
ncbi:MAG: DUF1343 domain-containing protein, partial [Planctomycetes bacterium]|nr:DUF1343 domain-containing protein [Planctomycetota bacterium]